MNICIITKQMSMRKFETTSSGILNNKSESQQFHKILQSTSSLGLMELVFTYNLADKQAISVPESP